MRAICNSVFGAPKIICVEPTQKKRSHIRAVTNHKSQICVCDTQTQMRYGNAPVRLKKVGRSAPLGRGTDQSVRSSPGQKRFPKFEHMMSRTSLLTNVSLPLQKPTMEVVAAIDLRRARDRERKARSRANRTDEERTAERNRARLAMAKMRREREMPAGVGEVVGQKPTMEVVAAIDLRRARDREHKARSRANQTDEKRTAERNRARKAMARMRRERLTRWGGGDSEEESGEPPPSSSSSSSSPDEDPALASSRPTTTKTTAAEEEEDAPRDLTLGFGEEGPLTMWGGGDSEEESGNGRHEKASHSF